jgi:hypothetical protein
MNRNDAVMDLTPICAMRDRLTRIYPLLVFCYCLLLSWETSGQDLEPRRWTTLPVGTTVLGAGVAHTNGDLFLDPVLRVESAEFDVHTAGLSYVRAFSIADKPVRFDALIPWQTVKWEGILDGAPASVTRSGLSDPTFRLSVNLAGAPAADPASLRKHLSARPVNTVVGAAVAVTVPLGEYFEDKLLNLGSNRFTVRPQVGVVHTRGPWSYELTGSVFLFSDNDEFFNGQKREQDPLYAMQSHVIRIFDRGLWASLSAGYAWGGRSTVSGVGKADEKGIFLSALSAGFPIGRSQAFKVAYIRSRTTEDTGADSDTLAAAWSVRF